MFINPEDSQRRVPDFFLIGAAKSGTTSLYSYLNQHSEIFFSDTHKEAGYFCFSGNKLINPDNGLPPLWDTAMTDFEEYCSLFSGAENRQLVGDATPEYLLFPDETIKNIEVIYLNRLADLKFVAMLRNPVERIWSHYWMMRRDGFENLDFDEAASKETIRKRLGAGWHPAYDYLGYGEYGRQIARYRDRFAADKLRIVLFEDFRADPVKVCQELFAFLGVDPSYRPDVSVRHNVSGVLRHPVMHKWLFTREHQFKSMARRLLPHATLQRIKASLVAWNCRPVQMPTEIKIRLVEYYRDDVLTLSTILGRDLSSWLHV